MTIFWQHLGDIVFVIFVVLRFVELAALGVWWWAVVVRGCDGVERQ